MSCYEMRWHSPMHHVSSLYQLPLYSSPCRLQPHIAMPMCDKIHHLWITSNYHFTKQIHFFSNQNLFGCYTSMIIYVFKTICHFCRQQILGVPSQTSHAFLHFHDLPRLEICITTCTGTLTRGGVYPYLLLPDTCFQFHVSNGATLLNFIQRYRVH